MSDEFLCPRFELLSRDYVLVQAWKKTASYIRYHNWYSDTLELDRASVNLPRFLAELSDQLKDPKQWKNDPLRIVPAPKNQQWRVNIKTKKWGPLKRGKDAVKLRPLAHVSLKDQVAATALMLCLADRVETLQGDPRSAIEDGDARKSVVSYGNRLFCDANGESLHHRWGSGKLYRAYFQDYQKFLERPEIAAVAETATTPDGTRAVIVHSDLHRFYDTVRPKVLNLRIEALKEPNDDPDFFEFSKKLLSWVWHGKDEKEVSAYASKAELGDFSRVALPQGLVSAGFFANIALLDFDQGLRESVNQEIRPKVSVVDVCRYVDDLRIVLAVGQKYSLTEVEQLITIWLQELLDNHAPGLKVSQDKTKAVAFSGDERLLVRQSRKMRRIQGAISGGFDVVGGQDILYSIQGLVRSQQRYSEERTKEQGWSFSPIPDVGDATVARFAAARFRSTYRSLRPLLVDCDTAPGQREDEPDVCQSDGFRLPRTQSELDDEVRAFALGLIETWVGDPSNVRLLRIGLDLWPAEDVLKGVLNLLRPYTEKGGLRKDPRRVAWYCLSEIFRAGATETGFVDDHESLPKEIDLKAYRLVLLQEANRLTLLPPANLPWYLKQQVLLFLAANNPKKAPILRTGHNAEIRHYRELIRFLRGENKCMKNADFATLAVLSRRSFLGQAAAVELVERDTTTDRLEQIAERDPSFAIEILELMPGLSQAISPRLRDDLCLDQSVEHDQWVALPELALQRGSANGPLRNELTLLSFAMIFLEAWPASKDNGAITKVDPMSRPISTKFKLPKYFRYLDLIDLNFEFLCQICNDNYTPRFVATINILPYNKLSVPFNC